MTQIVFLMVFQKVQSDMPMPLAMPLTEQMGFPGLPAPDGVDQPGVGQF